MMKALSFMFGAGIGVFCLSLTMIIMGIKESPISTGLPLIVIASLVGGCFAIFTLSKFVERILK